MPKAASRKIQKPRTRKIVAKPPAGGKAKAAASPTETSEAPKDRVTGPLPEYVGTGELAALLDYSRQWIAKLVQEGVLTKEGRGNFHLKRSVLACIAYARRLENDRAQESAGDRLKETRRLEVERNMARDDRKIISLDESLEALDSIVGLFVESIESIPGQIADDQDQRAKAHVVIDRIRASLSTRLAKEQVALRTGKRPS